MDLPKPQEALVRQSSWGQEQEDAGFPGLYEVRHAQYAQSSQCSHTPAAHVLCTPVRHLLYVIFFYSISRWRDFCFMLDLAFRNLKSGYYMDMDSLSLWSHVTISTCMTSFYFIFCRFISFYFMWTSVCLQLCLYTLSMQCPQRLGEALHPPEQEWQILWWVLGVKPQVLWKSSNCS